jgi:hypothetical protein
MTLSVSLFQPDKQPYEFVSVPEIENVAAAGFENYRSRLWGATALSDRGAIFLPVLRHDDLYVTPEQFASFRSELAVIHRNARDIAAEIWPYGIIDRYCPIQRTQRIRALRIRDARDIRTYISRFRFALNVAERSNLGFNIG